MGCREVLVALAVLVLTLGGSESTSQQADVAKLLQEAGLIGPSLKVAAFNIESFGKSKYEKANVTAVLKKILARYDLTLVQEIRDKSEKYFPMLVQDIIDAGNPEIAYIMGPRLGRTSSKEQYAYIYRKDRLNIVQTLTYLDTKDVYEREPYCVLLNLTDSVTDLIGVIGIHTKPTDAPSEIDALVDVYDNVTGVFGTKDFILMGDMNADCDYVTSREWEDIRLKQDKWFTWLIGDDVDTTVTSTNCAYDRFVTAGPNSTSTVVPDSPKTFLFDAEYNLTQVQAEEVSDHYPIEMDIYGKFDQLFTDTRVNRSFTVSWPSRSNATALFSLNGNVIDIEGGFKAYSVQDNGFIQWEDLCENAMDALKNLTDSYPDYLHPQAVAMVGAYYLSDLLGNQNDVFPPMVNTPRPEAKTCSVKIAYSLTSPYPYTITMTRPVN